VVGLADGPIYKRLRKFPSRQEIMQSASCHGTTKQLSLGKAKRSGFIIEIPKSFQGSSRGSNNRLGVPVTAQKGGHLAGASVAPGQ
jgi:hypothetical protein